MVAMRRGAKQPEPIRIRVCHACGWRISSDAPNAGALILEHRDITCPNRLEASEKPHRPSTRVSSRKRMRAKVGPAKRSFCPTCRDELYRINDAWACVNGCSSEAIRAG